MANYFSKVFSRRIKLYYVIVLILFTSCKEIFEENITNKMVQVVLPQNNLQTANRVIEFKWEEMNGATSYQLEIVSPDFNNISTYELDSNISNTTFNFQLDPGTYQWRIRGINYNYQSKYSGPFDLTIDTSLDLSNQQIIGLTPSQNSYTNQTNITFSWNQINEADGYHFELKSGSDFSSGTPIFQQDSLTSESILVSGLDQGSYVFGVQAYNSIPSETTYSTSLFIIDTVAPEQATLTSPSSNFTSTSNQVTFYWTSPASPTTDEAPIQRTLEIYSDSLISLFDTQTINQTDSLRYTFNQSGDYFWRVVFQDEAGNQGLFSTSRKITIN